MVRRRSALLVAWFTRYARRYVSRRLHAVRILRDGSPAPVPQGPLVVLLNHPSWWDPLVCLLLTGLFPLRRHFAPMEEQALGKYRFFGRLGFFPVDPETPAGARAFLVTGLEILSAPGTALWITGHGRFADPRERPVALRPGAAHLARRLRAGTLLPLALEYPFWDERSPEALACFGEPIPLGGAERRPQEWRRLLEERLQAAQDRLASAAVARDEEAFQVILEGRSGVGGLYDLWRRLRAVIRGEGFRASHGSSQHRRTPGARGGDS